MKITKTQWLKAFPWFFLSLVVVLIDQWSKFWVMHHLQAEHPFKVLPFFNLTLRFNTGAAFNFLGAAGGWQVFFLSLISIAVIIFMVVWLLRLSYPNLWTACALSLLLGGAAGNLVDRLRISYVIDFFDFHLWHWHYATFNVADSAIVAGVLMLMIQIFFKNKPLKTV